MTGAEITLLAFAGLALVMLGIAFTPSR